MVAELNSTNTTATMQYIVGDGTVLAQQAGTSAPARFLLHDGQGSTRSLFDNGGTLLENYVYDAFGTLKAPTGTPQTRYLYIGQQFDAATKLYSLRARYYAPTQGRFTARDTADYNLQNPIELNRYGYTANNPISATDPSGHGIFEYFGTQIVNRGKYYFYTFSALGTAAAQKIAALNYGLEAKNAQFALRAQLLAELESNPETAEVAEEKLSQIMSKVTISFTRDLDAIKEEGAGKFWGINGDAPKIAKEALQRIFGSDRVAIGIGSSVKDPDLGRIRIAEDAEVALYHFIIKYANGYDRAVKITDGVIGISNGQGPCDVTRKDCQGTFTQIGGFAISFLSKEPSINP